ncbi:MAG: DUF1853 family protein [Vibrio sp.]
MHAWVKSHPSLFEPCPRQANPMSDPVKTVKLACEVAANPFMADYPVYPMAYQGNSRLGFWYQHICHQQFLSHPDFQVIFEEIQLFENKKTIGAIDFLIQDTRNQTLEHWEVAIKFYLLFDGLWYGPNSRDRLDLKLKHMLEHQLQMTQTLAFRHAYPEFEDISAKLLMQGRLYTNPFLDQITPHDCLGYPLNKSEIQGFWCYQSQWQQIDEPLFLLKKGDWLTGRTAQSLQVTEVGDQFIHCQAQSGKFWFIVPDTWPFNDTNTNRR